MGYCHPSENNAKMKQKIQSHSFNGTKFRIEEASEIEGSFDPQGKAITILVNKRRPLQALGSALEEGLHAMGVPDKYLHKPQARVKKGKSLSRVDDLARFIWRLGWRPPK